MGENVYKKARKNAATKDRSLRSVESTYEQVCITRERLLAIEQTDKNKKTSVDLTCYPVINATRCVCYSLDYKFHW